jgi:hypothetical protein
MEEVTPRMRTPCATCGKPCDGVRFKHVSEGFPFPETRILCSEDAVAAMRAVIKVDSDKVDAIQFYLETR